MQLKIISFFLLVFTAPFVAAEPRSPWLQLGETLLGDTVLLGQDVVIEEVQNGYKMLVPGKTESVFLVWPERPELADEEQGVVSYKAGRLANDVAPYALYIYRPPELQGLNYPRKTSDLKPAAQSKVQAWLRLDQARKVAATQLISRLQRKVPEETKLQLQLVQEEHHSQLGYSLFDYIGQLAQDGASVTVHFRMAVTGEAIYLLIAQGVENKEFIERLHIVIDGG